VASERADRVHAALLVLMDKVIELVEASVTVEDAVENLRVAQLSMQVHHAVDTRHLQE